jgi:hypothetical protein
MQDSLVRFNPEQTTLQIIDLYERALKRPLAHLKAKLGDSTDARIAA